jgi:hypothetical protein
MNTRTGNEKRKKMRTRSSVCRISFPYGLKDFGCVSEPEEIWRNLAIYYASNGSKRSD